MTTTTVPTVTDELISELEILAARVTTPMVTIPLSSLITLLAERADHLQQLAAAAITAENCEIFRKDAERLDWMINEVAVVHEMLGAAGSRYSVYWPDADDSQAAIYLTEREAIDAARAIADT